MRLSLDLFRNLKSWAGVSVILFAAFLGLLVGGTAMSVGMSNVDTPNLAADATQQRRCVTANAADAMDITLLSLKKYGVVRLGKDVEVEQYGGHWLVRGRCETSDGRTERFTSRATAREMPGTMQWRTIWIELGNQIFESESTAEGI